MDAQHWKFGFTRHHCCERAFFFVDSVSDQLNLDRFEFWLPTSQLLALDVCLFHVFA
ncbi:DUF645 family protein [Vibrio cholerae]|uniref:DUF645 family protein n=1 Tax=Vibrio cholerae TaxID=666 RepID=UPI0013903E99|nr:DUF645 family protein [Vibrio cholerae]EHS1102621.1 DUF645 family protein [Vibrio cholerae]EHV1354457.1 DUF645 family protein [Vibrio cholerae]EIB4934556.1 DUF645 family protein [Vibrio cholerae]EID7717260.1 DUF645 family protein [Vibrio cholerae]